MRASHGGREMSKWRTFVAWALQMVDRAPGYITTATPVLLIIINQALMALGTAHFQLPWAVQMLAYALLAGRFLRQALESGRAVVVLATIRQDAEALFHYKPMGLPTPMVRPVTFTDSEVSGTLAFVPGAPVPAAPSILFDPVHERAIKDVLDVQDLVKHMLVANPGSALFVLTALEAYVAGELKTLQLQAAL